MNKAREIKASRSDPEIYLSGEIGDFGWEDDITARYVKEQLSLHDGPVTIRLNSIGGIVLEGFSIYNAIKEHPHQVTIVIDVIAASIASYIAMAGDVVLMNENSRIMIHPPWNVIEGNSKDLRQAADELDMFKDTLVQGYLARTNLSKEELEQMIQQDTWFSAEEAIKYGFADGYVELPSKGSYNSRAVAKLRNHIKQHEVPESVWNHLQDFYLTQCEDTNMNKLNAKNEVIVEEEEILEVEEVVEELIEEAAEEGNTLLQEDLQEILELIEELGEDVEDPMAFLREAVTKNLTPKQAKNAIKERMAKNSKPVKTVHVQKSSSNRFDLMKNALNSRLGKEDLNPRNPYREASLHDLARASLEQAGYNTNILTRSEIAKAALFGHRNQGYTRSDFPELLQQGAQTILLQGFGENNGYEFEKFTQEIELTRGGEVKLAGLGPISDLARILEGTEYPEQKYGANKEKMELEKHGGIITLTWEMIMDDDLGAFTRTAQKQGFSARRKLAQGVSSVFSGNPTMGDGTALFHASHGNLLTGATSALSADSLVAARLLMRKQRDKTTKALFDIQPAYLIVPPELYGTAKALVASQYDLTSPATPLPNQAHNIVREVIEDPFLTDPTAWYMIADGRIEDVIGVGYRRGNKVPHLEEIPFPTRDAIGFKVRFESDVAALHFAGMVKSNGKA